MKNNTGLYIRRRRRGSTELWQLFLGGYTKAKPSALYYNYDKHFWKLHAEYEWVVLERRRSKAGMPTMYRVGDTEPVRVMKEYPLLPEQLSSRFRAKLVECLSTWHMDHDDKMFVGSISNRVCPECVRKEVTFCYDNN